MALDPKKRQKKLARKAAQRKEKKQLVNREKSIGLAERLSIATKYPVLHCRIPHSIANEGIGSVLISREMPNGKVAVSVFLVDVCCQGVKDAFAYTCSTHVLSMRESMVGRCS